MKQGIKSEFITQSAKQSGNQVNTVSATVSVASSVLPDP